MVKTVTRKDIRTAMDKGLPIVLVEALPEKYYAAEHLPGAVHLPVDEVEALATERLPHKDAAVIVYCSNEACNNSSIAANKLVALGYTDVSKYPAGKQDWIAAGLPVEPGGQSVQQRQCSAG